MTRQRKPEEGRDPSRLSAFQRFARNKSGAFAMQFALMVVPLVVCTGLAIDGGRSFLARYELESALDAAALAVGSTTADDATLNTLARKYVNSNFKAPDTTEVTLELHSSTDLVTLKGTTQLSTYFMPLMGISKVTVAAETEVRRGGSNVEVALMLDITGSMGAKTDPNSRISTLIRAANSMIDTVVNDVQTPWFTKVAIVPWANNVYVGAYADALRGPAAGTTITGATWKKDTQTINAIAWKNGSPFTVASATYSASTKTASKIQESSSKTTVTSNGHGFANGDYVYLTNANGGFSSLNNTIYKVAAVATNTFNIQTTAGVDINLTGTPSNANTATVEKCYNATCTQYLVTTTASHGLANGDTVYLSSIMTGIDSTQTSTTTTAVTLTAATIASTTGFYVTGPTPQTATVYNTGTKPGRVQKCYSTICQFQIQTTGSHTFTANERVYISGVTFTPSTGAPAINTSAGSSIQVPATLNNAFLFPTLVGPYYTNAYNTASGEAITCFGTAVTCEMQLTAPAHGLVANDRAFITGVVGLTGSTTVNNLYTGQGTPTSWAPTSITTDTFLLPGTTGPSMSAYTNSSGTVFCLKTGCKYYRYTANDSSNPIRPISNCVTERIGAQAYTEAAPGSGAWLGVDYPIAGDEYNDCIAVNQIVPLTSTKSTLHSTINNLQVTGSTAGQIGVGWGWYMLSPNFASIWPNAENQAKTYTTPHINKVMVLMTDGDFNTAHCLGVAAKDYQVGLTNSEKANCNSTNGAPYTQASTLCSAMRTAGISIYTVGFQVTAGSAADTFLAGCATQDSHHYFLASNNTELEAAFAQIATNISKLRISK